MRLHIIACAFVAGKPVADLAEEFFWLLVPGSRLGAALLSLEQTLCLLLDSTLPLTNLRRVNPVLLADLIDRLLPP